MANGEGTKITCKVCDQEVGIDSNGLIAQHFKEEGIQCEGTGKKPVVTCNTCKFDVALDPNGLIGKHIAGSEVCAGSGHKPGEEPSEQPQSEEGKVDTSGSGPIIQPAPEPPEEKKKSEEKEEDNDKGTKKKKGQ